ncbi:MAG TPA: preprotein translocase subunit YajC [Ignavibacteria bacterium]|nr:preprotein translocase subunit YajC [Ignavibacteria bacterium]
MGSLMSFLPFILIIAVFYFLIIRPQQKRQKERQKLLDSVKKGDKVITAAGIHGVVEGIEDKTVLVKISENVKVKMEKSSIATIIGVTESLEKK